MSFESFGLKAELLRAIDEQGYTQPTPVQLSAIPAVLEGRDLMAGAQTGTGKTAGFTLPMLQLLSERAGSQKRGAVRALILTPTRELAAQVAESVRDYGKYLRLRSTVIFGGVGFNPQRNKLQNGCDIVIATPGRLLDHMGQGTVDLSQVEMLILDEADRMLDMGFIHDIRRVIERIPPRDKRQTLMFSATFSSDIKTLARTLLNNPQLIEVAGTNSAAERVAQKVHPVDKERKRELLSQLIGQGNWQQVLVFTRTKHGANRLAEQLSTDGLKSAAIHGNKSQGARTKALSEFKQGKVRVLVATDIAARGLDIDQLPHVVNYELPNVPEDYVHRIGRTGRAGHEGEAVSLVSADEHSFLRSIEQLLKSPIPSEIIEGFTPLVTSAPQVKMGGGQNRSGGRGRGQQGGGGRPGGGYGGGAGNGRSRSNGRPANHAGGHNGRHAKPAGGARRKAGTRSGASAVFGNKH